MSNFDKPGQLTRRIFLGLAIAGLTAAPSRASTPEEYVKGVADDVMRIANSGDSPEAMKRRFDSILVRNVDTVGVATLSLGPFLKQLPAGRKNEYYLLVRRYIAAFFVYYVDEFKGAGLDIKSSSTQGRFTTIMSAIKGGDADSAQVRWRLVPRDQGYKVHDVNVRGVWLSIAMKQRFTDILKRTHGDFGPLFAELKSAETWDKQ
jgi:ABC-type transporter MlaC component